MNLVERMTDAVRRWRRGTLRYGPEGEELRRRTAHQLGLTPPRPDDGVRLTEDELIEFDRISRNEDGPSTYGSRSDRRAQ